MTITIIIVPPLSQIDIDSIHSEALMLSCHHFRSKRVLFLIFTDCMNKNVACILMLEVTTGRVWCPGTSGMSSFSDMIKRSGQGWVRAILLLLIPMQPNKHTRLNIIIKTWQQKPAQIPLVRAHTNYFKHVQPLSP